MAKTKVTVSHKPNPRNYVLPKPITGMEQVLFVKFLGVFLQSDIDTHKHVEYLSHICNQSLYLLNQIKQHGLSMLQLGI